MWEKYTDAAVDIGSNPVSKHQTQPECGEWAGWHETGRPNLSQETGSAGVNENKGFSPVQLTMDRIGKLTLNSRLLSGHLGFVAGTLRGSLFPVCYGSVGVQLTWPRALCPGTLTSQCVQTNLNTTVLQVTGTLQQSSRDFFVFASSRRCFSLNLSNRNK